MTIIEQENRTGLVELAERVATHAHAGQMDKAGFEYITHPRRVAAMLHTAGPIAQSAGWLHDVVEDTSVTLADLQDLGFPAAVVAAVDAVTKRSGEEPADYYARIRANKVGTQVKLADLRDNSDPVRLGLLDEPVQRRLRAKYANAFNELVR